MAFDYAELRTVADTLITSAGQTAAIRRSTNTGDAWGPTQATTDYTCTVVVTKTERAQRDGSSVSRKRKEVLVAVPAIVPTDADKFVLASEVHDIQEMAPLSPGGTVLLYQGVVWL